MAGLRLNKKSAKEVKLDKNIKDIEGEKVQNTDDKAFEDVVSSVDNIVNKTDMVKDNKNTIKLIVIGGVILLVCATGILTALSIPGVQNEDMPISDVVIDAEIPEIEDIEKDTTDTTQKEDAGTTTETLINPKKVLYENGMLGVALKYPSNWYIEERSDILLNMVQSTNASGNIDLSKDIVKLAGVVIDFSARDELSTKISLGVSPLVISGDTKLVEIQSLSDVLNVGTASQIDEQIKKNISAGGGTLISSTPSILKDVGDRKIIVSKYQFDKNGIKMDVIQMLMPFGQNNIILTSTSKIGNNPINKEEVLLDMIGSLGKIGEVELTDEDLNLDEIKENEVKENSTETVDNSVDNVSKAEESKVDGN